MQCNAQIIVRAYERAGSWDQRSSSCVLRAVLQGYEPGLSACGDVMMHSHVLSAPLINSWPPFITFELAVHPRLYHDGWMTCVSRMYRRLG